MADATLDNQKALLKGQELILANQQTIIANQNQMALIISNQRELLTSVRTILTNQERILANQQRLLDRWRLHRHPSRDGEQTRQQLRRVATAHDPGGRSTCTQCGAFFGGVHLHQDVAGADRSPPRRHMRGVDDDNFANRPSFDVRDATRGSEWDSRRAQGVRHVVPSLIVRFDQQHKKNVMFKISPRDTWCSPIARSMLLSRDCGGNKDRSIRHDGEKKTARQAHICATSVGRPVCSACFVAWIACGVSPDAGAKRLYGGAMRHVPVCLHMRRPTVKNSPPSCPSMRIQPSCANQPSSRQLSGAGANNSSVSSPSTALG